MIFLTFNPNKVKRIPAPERHRKVPAATAVKHFNDDPKRGSDDAR
jgi:hypothetical protein